MLLLLAKPGNIGKSTDSEEKDVFNLGLLTLKFLS
jgi:hypothetical protein